MKRVSIKPLVKQCIAEVITEPQPPRRNAPRSQFTKFIKNCVFEVLKENLTEGFDPTSQGPNIPQENPYPEWNAKMAKLEEGDVIYKDRQGGQWVYWMDNTDTGGRIQVSPQNVEKYLKRGYRLVALEPWNDPNAVKGLKEIGPHGRYAQEAGAGQFDPRTFGKLNEYDDHEATISRVKKEVYAALKAAGFIEHGDEPRQYMEYYLNGFVTVQLGISYDSRDAHVERYYDSEMVDNMPGHHVSQKFPIPKKYNPEFVKKLIRYTVALKRAGEGDESIFGGIDDLQEGNRIQSVEVPWPCPKCGQETLVSVQVESPSDYIASNDCEHCGQEINDPNLDAKVMQAVQDYFVGKAEYQKDTLREGFGGARFVDAKIIDVSSDGTPSQGTIGAIGKYPQYNVTAEVNLTVYSDSPDKRAIAKDVYTRLQAALG